jgi:hypothetical protein
MSSWHNAWLIKHRNNFTLPYEQLQRVEKEKMLSTVDRDARRKQEIYTTNKSAFTGQP